MAPAIAKIMLAALNLLNTGKDLYIMGSAGLVPGLQHIVKTWNTNIIVGLQYKSKQGIRINNIGTYSIVINFNILKG